MASTAASWTRSPTRTESETGLAAVCAPLPDHDGGEVAGELADLAATFMTRAGAEGAGGAG